MGEGEVDGEGRGEIEGGVEFGVGDEGQDGYGVRLPGG